MTDTPPAKVIGAVLCLLLLSGAWMHGRFHGAQSAIEHTATQVDSTVAIQARYPGTDDDVGIRTTADVISRQTGSNVLPAVAPAVLTVKQQAEILALRATVEALESSLQATQVQSDQDAAELELYRRIASSVAPAGSLAVDAISYTEDPQPTLNLTLVQWRGRNRISGKLIADVGYRDAAATAVAGSQQTDTNIRNLGISEYQFRFFQHLSIPVAMPQIEPDFLELRLEPDGRGAKDVVQRLQWADLTKIVD